jgi:hypothetical protein
MAAEKGSIVELEQLDQDFSIEQNPNHAVPVQYRQYKRRFAGLAGFASNFLRLSSKTHWHRQPTDYAKPNSSDVMVLVRTNLK